MTIAEAADYLGVQPIAIRSRIKRRTLRIQPGKTSEDGLVRVWIERKQPEEPLPAPTADSAPDHTADPRAGPVAGLNADEYTLEFKVLRANLKATQQRLSDVQEHAAARLADKDAEVAFLREQLRVRDEQVSRMQVLLQTEQQHVRQLADQCQTEPAAPAAPWWRFWRRG